MAINPNDPFSDPFRPGREAAKRAQDDAAAANRRFQDSIARTNATTAATIKRNQDALAEGKRRDEFTKQIRESHGKWQGSSGGVGAGILALLLPILFLAAIGVIGYVAWKMMS